jgi:predicted transcriptional regulator
MGLTLGEIAEELGAEIHCGEQYLDMVCERIAAGDLMSDLLRIPFDGVVLLTGLNNVQAVRTCLLTNMKALILVRGKRPGEEVLREARSNGLPVLSTRLSLFTSCGRLYARGLKGIP